MTGLLQRLLPREEGFFDLFRKQAENIHRGAEAFQKILLHYTGVPEQVQNIKAIEHDGDEITHQTFRMLNKTFITPFDREDIHELVSTMDDVIDLIDAAASRFDDTNDDADRLLLLINTFDENLADFVVAENCK